MKKILIALSITFFIACSNSNVSLETKKDTTDKHIVGNDKDEHNCIGSAGYTWSIVKNKCIRVFEDGIRLNAVAKGIDTTTSVFIVFESDTIDTKAELFFPAKKESIILQKTEKESAGIWQNDSLQLQQWKGKYMLNDRKGKTLYEGVSIK